MLELPPNLNNMDLFQYYIKALTCLIDIQAHGYNMNWECKDCHHRQCNEVREIKSKVKQLISNYQEKNNDKTNAI